MFRKGLVALAQRSYACYWRVIAPRKARSRVLSRGWASLIQFEGSVVLLSLPLIELRCTHSLNDAETGEAIDAQEVRRRLTNPSDGSFRETSFKVGGAVLNFHPRQPWTGGLVRRIRFAGSLTGAPDRRYTLVLYFHGRDGKSKRCLLDL